MFLCKFKPYFCIGSQIYLPLKYIPDLQKDAIDTKCILHLWNVDSTQGGGGFKLIFCKSLN